MEFIVYEQKGAYGIITISREKALNALNSQVLEELDATLDAVNLDEVRCLILTGAGQKSFVAGADIGEMSTLTKAEGEAFGKKGNDVFRKLETFPIPVIAAINGFALGGGCEISMSCDIRICSDNAVFGQPEVGLGITPGFGGTQRLARLVGAGMAKQMIYTARNIKADEAYRIGLVNAVYTQEELTALYATCQKYGLRLFIDGARLGYGLESEACDYDLPFLAKHCDVFYIGGTKVGAMMGEAVVFSGMKAPKYFFTNIKRHGALLAKGRMLGIQFDTLFTDNLYFKISRHAIAMATRIRSIFQKHGIAIAYDSPTNQQFVVLSPSLYDALSKKVAFEIWERKSDTEIICRFVTSWATKEEELDELEHILRTL